MTYSIYLFGIFIATLFGWASFIVVLNKLSPITSTAIALIFFYSSLFFALTTSFALVGYYIRMWLNRNEVYFSHINISLRQGALLAVVVCLSLGFQSMRVLTWWDAMLLLILALFVELYFMGKDV
jgi:hypothetical protein